MMGSKYSERCLLATHDLTLRRFHLLLSLSKLYNDLPTCKCYKFPTRGQSTCQMVVHTGRDYEIREIQYFNSLEHRYTDGCVPQISITRIVHNLLNHWISDLLQLITWLSYNNNLHAMLSDHCSGYS